MNKKYLTFSIIGFFVFGLLFLIGCGSTPSSENTASLLTYTDSARNIQLQYPAAWTKTDIPGVGASFEANTKLANVNVGTQDLAGLDITLDKYAELTVNQIKNSPDLAANILETSNTTLSGLPAKKIVYTIVINKINMKGMQIVALKDSKVYLVTYTAETSNYDKYFGNAQSLIDSFQITR